MKRLDQADVIVLLVSADFFASDDVPLCNMPFNGSSMRVYMLYHRATSGRMARLSLAALSCIPFRLANWTGWMDKDTASDQSARDLRRLLGYRLPPAQRAHRSSNSILYRSAASADLATEGDYLLD